MQKLHMGYQNGIIKNLLRGKNIFRIIMGTITTWLLMIAFQAEESTAAVIVMDIVIFAVLLLMSYLFASVVAEEIINRQRTNLRRIFEILREVSPVIIDAVPPLLIFIIAVFDIITEKTDICSVISVFGQYYFLWVLYPENQSAR